MARGSVNKVILIGALGRDPEIRYMPNGGAVANLNLATDEGYNDRATGQKVEKTEWHRVVAYARLAEIMGEYLKKGAKVYIEGKLQTREWEKDGIKRYTTEIVAHEMTMLDGGATTGEYQQPAAPAGGYQQPMAPAGEYQQPMAPRNGQPRQSANNYAAQRNNPHPNGVHGPQNFNSPYPEGQH